MPHDLATQLEGIRADELAGLRSDISGLHAAVGKRRAMLILTSLIAVFYAMTLVFLLPIVSNTQQTVKSGQRNGNITRALLCETILYDGDRKSPPPPICFAPAIVKEYEPAFCADFPEVCLAKSDG